METWEGSSGHVLRARLTARIGELTEANDLLWPAQGTVNEHAKAKWGENQTTIRALRWVIELIDLTASKSIQEAGRFCDAIELLDQVAAVRERVEFHTLMDSAIEARNRLLSS